MSLSSLRRSFLGIVDAPIDHFLSILIACLMQMYTEWMNWVIREFDIDGFRVDVANGVLPVSGDLLQVRRRITLGDYYTWFEWAAFKQATIFPPLAASTSEHQELWRIFNW